MGIGSGTVQCRAGAAAEARLSIDRARMKSGMREEGGVADSWDCDG